jgi:hypothetical protein
VILKRSAVANSNEIILPIISDKRQLKACVHHVKVVFKQVKDTQNYGFIDLRGKDL